MKTLRHYPFCIIHFALAFGAHCALNAQQPLFPADTGTYYYDGYDADGDRYVYISATGTYYYVDTGGVTTPGEAAALPVASPWCAVITASSTNFTFNNAHPNFDPIAGSGTWTTRDTTLNLTTGAGSAISISGLTGTNFRPATFIGENLTIVAESSNAGAITMGNGNNTIFLKNSTITSVTTRGNTSQAILLADTQNLGGNHFYGENLTITNNSGRLFAFGMGDNTITLVSSTVVNNGRGAAFGWNATTTSTRRSFVKGSFVTLQDSAVSTTADYSPIFQMIGDWGRATVTGGTLSTAGAGSTILRLVAQNDLNDHAKFVATFTGAVLEALQGSVIDINIDAADSANYGQGGGANKAFTTNIDDSFDILIASSTVTGGVAALRMAAAGSHVAPYGQRTNILVRDSVFAGGIQMIAGGGINETSGAYLTFTAYNAQISGGLAITGTSAARLSNDAIFHVYDSTFAGDITLTDRGNLVLHFTDTPIDGSLSLSGSTNVELRLANSPITGAVAATDTAILTGHAGGTGTVGPITAGGSAIIDLDLDHMPAGLITVGEAASVSLRVGDGTLPDGIHLSGSAVLDLTLLDTVRFAGDVTILDRATLATATARGDTLTLDGDLALAGIWRITGKAAISGSLAFIHPLGTIAIANAGPDSLVLANGVSGNGRLDILSIDGNALGVSEIRVIHDQTGAFTSAVPEPLVLAHPVDYGLAAYDLENRSDGAYLVGGLAAGSFGSGGAAVFNSRTLAAEDWFAALAPLNYRLAQLRQSGDASPPSRGSVWLQARADNTRVNRSGASLDFTSRTYGLTAGVDTRRNLEAGTLHMGIFADSARTLRNFIGSAEGLTTGGGGGLYAHYQHRAGLHLSTIARFDVYETTLDTRNANNDMNASYHSQAGGIALEAGWRLGLGKGWWLEPAAQIALASLPGVSYTTESSKQGNVIPISTSDARAAQWLGRLAFGKTLHKNWHLRGHLARASISASGGAFTAPGLDNADFTIAGGRTEVSLGVVRHIGLTGRITLDVAYTAASDYKRPCNLSMGWSMAW